MRIAIFGNNHQHEHIGDLEKLFSALERNKVEIDVEGKFLDYISSRMSKLPPIKSIITSSDDISASIAISVGGDGTFLRTARKVALHDIPILGINTGHLGYLADVPVAEIDNVIDDVIKGEYFIEERSVIEVASEHLDVDFPYALNEVAILKQDTSSMIEMRTEINGIPLTTYLGDGLIVATPTGSTAYNLSVGGPIIEPASRSFAISPVAAHSLTMRPLVVNDDCTIHVATRSRASAYRLSLDGRSFAMPTGSCIEIRKAAFSVKVMQRVGHNFASTLRNKLMWGMNNC